MKKLVAKRSGKIKIRLFALMLLIISCSFVLSGFRSLNREFEGTVIKKHQLPGVISNQYQLSLVGSDFFGEEQWTEIITKAILLEDSDFNKVGVSSFIFEESEPLSQVSKSSLSPFVLVNGVRFIDLGVQWLFMGAGGTILSFWMYLQTLQKVTRPEKSEDLEFPGM